MTCRIATISVAVAAMMALGACQPAVGEDEGGAATGQSGALTFTTGPNIKEDVQAMPRLTGDTPQIAAINADLDRVDAGALEAGCEAGGHSRFVSQPMTGPDFVTFAMNEEIYCESAAYPSNDQTAITYDLSTGARADWAALMPGLAPAQDAAMDGMPAGYVYDSRSPELAAWYERKMLAGTDPDHVEQCRDVWAPGDPAELGQGFRIWADAEHGAVAVSANYPHVIQACADIAYMTVEDMQTNGVDARLIEAITAAHAAGNWAPREDGAAAE